HSRRFVQLQLIDSNEGLIVEHALIHHDGPLWATDVFPRRIFEIDRYECRPVVIDEYRFFGLDHLHQSADAKDLVSLSGAGAAADDQFTRAMTSDRAQNGSQGVGLSDATRVVFGSPGVIRLHRDDLSI